MKAREVCRFIMVLKNTIFKLSLLCSFFIPDFSSVVTSQKTFVLLKMTRCAGADVYTGILLALLL